MINNAKTINDLRVPPANRLENWLGSDSANTASASMINGEFALSGVKIVLIMWR